MRSERSLVDLEKRLHDSLDAAGHARAHGARVGNEWFITTVEFLDSLAELAGLEIIKVGEPVDVDEDDDFFGGREALDEEAFAQQVQIAHDELVEAGREPTAAAIRTVMRAAGYRASKNRVIRFLPNGPLDVEGGPPSDNQADADAIGHVVAPRGDDR
jgi:hypothetical protein